MRACGIRSLLIAALLAAAPLAHGQEDDAEGGQGGAALPPLGEAAANALNEAIELMDAGNFAQARVVVEDLDRRRLSPYEIGRVEQILGNIAYSEGDFAGAREHFDLAMASGGLNEVEAANLKFQVAQLFLGDELWAEAAEEFEEWFALAANPATGVRPNSMAFFYLAIAYYELEEFDKALTNARAAVDLAAEPREDHLQLLIALLMQREDYQGAREQLERVLVMAPQKKNYWLQLSSVHAQMENYEEALATVEIPYLAGMLSTGAEVRRVADLLLFNQIGHRCARVMEKGMADGLIEADLAAYEKLGDCWLQSGELDSAAEAIGKAAPLAPTGKIFVRLGEVEIRRERYAAAAAAFQAAIDKGGLDDLARVQLFMGLAIYNGDSPCGSREWFERARSSAQHRANAVGYLQALDFRQVELQC
jgi:tetratricopeptide (TPR) repeat protein